MNQPWVLIGILRTPPAIYWTGQHYTDKPDRALRFGSQEEATRWLQVHKHLRAWLRVAQLSEACNEQQ